MRRIIIALLLLALLAIPAKAETVAVDSMGVGIAYWNNVNRGFRQTYRVQIRPIDEPVQDAYILLFVYAATDVTSVSSTNSLACAQHGADTVTVLCSAETLTDTQTLTINGIITGPATHGIYAQLRVGFAELGTVDRGVALKATYHGDDPTDIAPADEPARNTIYLPEIWHQ